MKKTLLVIALIYSVIASAQFTKLLDFDSINGSNPHGSLIYDGTFLYGMTSAGGVGTCGYNGLGCGIIFKIMPNGSGYTKLFDFINGNGFTPLGSLISDSTFLYGMTEYSNSPGSRGVVFKIKSDGSGYTVLRNFSGSNGDGNYAYDSPTIIDTVLYGMTYAGGWNGDGNIFKLNAHGNGYTDLHDFPTPSNDGVNPRGSLITDGTFLYGMTSGTAGGTNSNGTIFKVMPNGTGYSKILDLTGANGYSPYGSLYYDGTFLYGMASAGGACAGGVGSYGTMFKIKPDGSGYLGLHSFGCGTDGGLPLGSLVSDGTFLYGMTSEGGSNNMGLLFKIKTNGTGYDTLFNFSNSKGGYPQGSLLLVSNCLYGMTSSGGAYNKGTIFSYCLQATGIQKIASSIEQINIYPNPSDGCFIIKLNSLVKQTAQIYDVNGRMVLSLTIKGNTTVDASSLNEGAYYISIVGSESIMNKKIIIVK